MSAPPLVELRDVSFAYAASRRTRARPFRLTGISLAVAPGEIVAVIGPNSSGKTTLLRLLSKVLVPASGDILLGGRPLGTLSRWEVARTAAVVPQHLPDAFPFTVGEMVLMGRYPHGPDRFFESGADHAVARRAMAATGVLELAGSPLAELAGGERQRAVLARALAQEPRLLLLDEPTAHLDLRHQAETVALLRHLNRASGITVVLVSHDLNLAAEVADRLLLLADGRMERLGPPETVLDEPTLARVYGCPVVVDKHPFTRRPAVHVRW